MSQTTRIPNWILEDLSPEQQQAFEVDASSNHLMLAGAGSGKTRVLTRLVAAELLRGTEPSDLVVFTFTEKAADELVARLHSTFTNQLSELDTNGMFVGTIHSWCLRHLEQDSKFIGYTPIDELHTDSLVSRLYDDLGLETAYGLAFPRGIANFITDLEIFYNDSIVIAHVPRRVRPSIQLFLKILKDEKLLTFGEMIRQATKSLTEATDDNSRVVYVDEYQDINPAQADLLEAMTFSGGRITAVGDEMQSIYHWRGSDVGRILNFEASNHPAVTTRLQRNYRSRPGIVDLSQKIVAATSLRDSQKQIVAGRSEDDKHAVRHISVQGQEEQARVVADLVEKLHESGKNWSQIAVLLRSVVSSGPAIVDELSRRGIPIICPILGRSSEIVHELLIPLLDWIARSGDPINTEVEEQELQRRSQSLLEQARVWGKSDLTVQELWDGIDPWVDAIQSGSDDAYNIRSLVYEAFDKFGVRIGQFNSDLLLGLSIASQIIRSVEEIHRRRLREYPRRTALATVKEVLYGLHRHMSRFGESTPISVSEDAVAVMTIHQAKGLEWSSVILPQMLERRFPVLSGGISTSFDDEIAGRYKTTEDDERRLYYVAATRAMDRLFLVDPTVDEPERRSRFTREIGIGVEPVNSLDALDQEVFEYKSSQEIVDLPPVRVGISDLLLYMECPFSFALRRMAGLQPSVGDELGFGQSLHELIQTRFLHGQDWSTAELSAVTEEVVRLPYMSESRESNSKKAIEKRISALQNLKVFDSDLSSEIDVSLTLDGGTINGIVDGIETLGDGSRRIRDWKSNIHGEFLPRYQRQLMFYALAVASEGNPADLAELVDVSKTERQNELSAMEINIDKQVLQEFERELKGALQGIQGVNFTATPSAEACGSCDMYRVCGERIKD